MSVPYSLQDLKKSAFCGIIMLRKEAGNEIPASFYTYFIFPATFGLSLFYTFNNISNQVLCPLYISFIGKYILAID